MIPRIAQKPTLLLNRGLITEAGELSFPEGASVDELNMTIEKNGTRRRRLGIEFEDDYQVFSAGITGESIISTHIWENAGNVSGLNFVVVQIGNTLHFYKENVGALSENKKSFTVNLSVFNRPSGFGASSTQVDTTTIEGILVVASSEINTFKVEYSDSTDSITTEVINFRIRDFAWQGNIEEYYVPVSGSLVTNQRHYDTLNTGWYKTDDAKVTSGQGFTWSQTRYGPTALDVYSGLTGSYPPLSKPPFIAKNEDNKFDLDEFNLTHAGSSLIANGSYILDLYDQNREAVSGVTGLNTVETTRFKTVATYAGRVFYAGMSNTNSDKIYFSQLLYQMKDIGRCYQVNDPTAETFSDLLDTDGGFIQIKGAYNIKKLHVLGPYLIVFAENGIWYISGVDDVFRATEYSVSKISEVGIESQSSFVSAEGRPYWWSKFGIHTIVTNEAGALSERNLSRPTIHTFWSAIPPVCKTSVKSVYDSLDQKVYWFYRESTLDQTNEYNRVLIFDELNQAFIPWKISDASDSTYIVAPLFLKGNLSPTVVFNVIDSNGNQVVDSLGNDVVVTRNSRSYGVSNILCAIKTNSGGLTFGKFTNTGFVDWGVSNYDSYLLTGYDFTGDLSSSKIPVYLGSYFTITEEGYSGNEDDGYELIRPSSCLVSMRWDFSKTSSSNPQQAYRLKNLQIPSGPTFDYPRTVTYSRLKLRGRGKSFNIKFESEEGKDFHLQGFDVITGLAGK